MTREPAVAGRFYPGNAAVLSAEVAGFLPAAKADPCLGLVAPHAGYLYSGAIAGATYARVKVPDRAIVLCPNHTGRGARASLSPDDAWRLPGGEVPIDAGLGRSLEASGLVTPDREAHRGEHAIEVQLPFLLARNPKVRIAALCLADLSFERCAALGEAVASTAREHGALVVASSDMSHYLPAEVARAKDQLALDRLLALDPEGLHAVVNREDLSMCGYIPATVMLCATIALGAKMAELVRYGNSGEASGDLESVVGYAGILVR
jgi:AmmeMemoRadiSam system protein B